MSVAGVSKWASNDDSSQYRTLGLAVIGQAELDFLAGTGGFITLKMQIEAGEFLLEDGGDPWLWVLAGIDRGAFRQQRPISAWQQRLEEARTLREFGSKGRLEWARQKHQKAAPLQAEWTRLQQGVEVSSVRLAGVERACRETLVEESL